MDITLLAVPNHPGIYLKAALPKGVSVKKAAELMGVGRPALSNLLNGKAALTLEICATRRACVWNKRLRKLIGLQATYDEFQRREQAKEIAVRNYVPTFLGIEARQIAAWSEETSARSELAAFLRRLIHSTGRDLTKVEFPAYDNAQRHGWDGFVSTDAATPWIPRGDSGWEFGCDRNAAQKAEEDYTARTTSITPQERRAVTFIFVTPRNWPGKEVWARAKRAIRAWRNVVVYDASDLEQWVEQSPATQAWFAERIGNGAAGIATLDASWKNWSGACNPPLSKSYFDVLSKPQRTSCKLGS